MNAFDATKPTVDAFQSSLFTSSLPDHDEHDVMSRRLPHFMSCHAKAEGTLRDALERNDGKLLTTAVVLDAQLDHSSGSSSNERVRLRARRPSRPALARLESRPPARRELIEVDLIGRSRAESRMRPFRVVPGGVVIELASECRSRQRNDRQKPCALVLQGTYEPLDHGEAAVLADGAEALLDAATPAPCSEIVRSELHAVIRDDVPRPEAELAANAIEPSRGLERRWLLLESRCPHHAAREVIDDDGDPPTERPTLRHGKRKPRDPESSDRRNGGEIEVPDVIGVFRGDGSRLRWTARCGLWLGSRLEYPSDRRCCEMKSAARKHASDPSSPHSRTEDLESPYQVADQLRKPIDGLSHLNERVGSFVIESLGPRGDRQRGYEEPSRGLRPRPAPGRAQFENREPLGRRVVRPALRVGPLHAGVLDAQLVAKQPDLALLSRDAGPEADELAGVGLGASPRDGKGHVDHRGSVDDVGADVSGPVLGQRNPLIVRSCRQESPHDPRTVRSLPIGIFRVY